MKNESSNKDIIKMCLLIILILSVIGGILAGLWDKTNYYTIYWFILFPITSLFIVISVLTIWIFLLTLIES